jgi:hypothetical protein
MKATILHDEHGQIIAVSMPGDFQQAGSNFTKVGVIPGRGQRLLETDLEGGLEHVAVLELHKEYHVDLARSKLVKGKSPTPG